VAEYEGWAIVELMGHRRLAGWVQEVELAGAPMLRLDVPEHEWLDGCTCGSEQPASDDPYKHQHHCFRFSDDDRATLRPVDVHATQFYSPAALYCLTPTTEETARLSRSRPAPIQTWEIQRPALAAAPAIVDEPDEWDPRDEEHDEF
jgi:hypothetical protein